MPNLRDISRAIVEHASRLGTRATEGRWYAAGYSPPPRTVEPTVFRSVMAALPTGVGVVTALDASGNPRGLTCSAIASVSLTPPQLLVCVDLRNGSLRAIRESKGFVVNVLAKDAAEVSQTFASRSADKFAAVQWRPSRCSGLPVLTADSVAYADCRLEREIVAGDHAILIGCLRDGQVPEPCPRPLMYWQRQYASWPDTVHGLANAS